MAVVLEPITPAHLPALARHLAASLAELAARSGFQATGNSLADVEARLRWRLLERPKHGDDALGECVRTDAGEVVASLAYTPTAFRLGDARVLGLLGGYFFAGEQARGYGLVMFRRFLAAPGCDFAYSTSLNAASGGLWKRLGGAVPAGCDAELLVPLNLGPVVAELTERRASRAAVARLLGLGGSVASPLWRVALGAGRALRLAPCDDWEALADLAERHRPRGALVAELTPEVLRWRFERSPARARIDVLRFDVGGGRAGWLATIASRRGQEGGLRTRTVLTLVRPATDFDESALLRALVRHYAGAVDLLVLGSPLEWSAPGAPRVLRRALEHPPVYMRGADEAGRPWVERMRYALGDGDAIE